MFENIVKNGLWGCNFCLMMIALEVPMSWSNFGTMMFFIVVLRLIDEVM